MSKASRLKGHCNRLKAIFELPAHQRESPSGGFFFFWRGILMRGLVFIALLPGLVFLFSAILHPLLAARIDTARVCGSSVPESLTLAVSPRTARQDGGTDALAGSTAQSPALTGHVMTPAAPRKTVVISFVQKGNVGIGTTAPWTPLNVVGPNYSSAFPGNIVAMDSTASAKDVGGGFILSGKSSAGGAESWFGGIHGGKENSTDGDYAGYVSILTRANGSGTFTEGMRVTSAGNVGIGTANPEIRLIHENALLA